MHFCRLSLRREGVLGICCLVVSLFRRCITFWKKCKLYRRWHWWGTGKIISDLNGSLWSRQFLNVANKRTCFASCASAFKSSGLITRLECLLPVTYLLRAMWHIRLQHNPANHVCQPQPFVPHSTSSIPLFPFLSPPSFSMLSLVFPVFAAPLGPRLMQFCGHCLVLSSWCGRWISIFSVARPHWGFQPSSSQPSSGLLCL